MEMKVRANVVDDPGMKPNWLGSTCFRITGFNSVSITILLAILDNVEVNEIGLKSLRKSRIIEDLNSNNVRQFPNRWNSAFSKRRIYDVGNRLS